MQAEIPSPSSEPQIATLAGGCFWCLEAAFTRLAGIEGVMPGFMGGNLDHPSYEAVCRGDSGHAEVVQIYFHPQQISYESLLDVFFTLHDPTTLNRQGNDKGTQYRSAIFYHTPAQQLSAEEQLCKQSARWEQPIVTQIAPATLFWPADPSHRQYFVRHPQQAYCQLVIAPKIDKIEQQFSRYLRSTHNPFHD